MLPDGTIVVPIGSEDDEDGIEPGSDENESKYGKVILLRGEATETGRRTKFRWTETAM